MIGYLAGTLISKKPESLILDVNGVGYELFIPASTLCALTEVGSTVKLHVYTHVREDALKLYGFIEEFDKTVFEALLNVNSVGPKMAVSLLSPCNGTEFCNLILQENRTALTNIPGVGGKTAERLILELKSKVLKLLERQQSLLTPLPQTSGNSTSSGSHLVIDDVKTALIGIGYKEKEIAKAIQQFENRVQEEKKSFTLESALKEMLKMLTNPKFFFP